MTNRLFLEEHSPDCNMINNPCPSCRAWELIKASGLGDDIRRLLQEWQQGQDGDNLHTPLFLLGLSVRTYNFLESAGLKNLDQVSQKTEAELLRIDRFGRKSLHEIKALLYKHGLQLKSD